jgi:hypothetical protein
VFRSGIWMALRVDTVDVDGVGSMVCSQLGYSSHARLSDVGNLVSPKLQWVGCPPGATHSFLDCTSLGWNNYGNDLAIACN